MDIEYNSRIIGELLCDNFNIKQIRISMYNPKDIYNGIPAQYFCLCIDGNEHLAYKKINESVVSFNGNLIWIMKKAFKSKINYMIIPENFTYTGDFKFEKNELFKKLCDLAIADIPILYEHMKSKFM